MNLMRLIFSLISSLIFIYCHSQTKLKTLLFLGNYTEGKPDKGLYIYSFNEKTGALTYLSHCDSITNPSYITISANGKQLYACTETKLPKEGSVSSFNIDNVKGKLTFNNKQAAGGENPVYLSLDKSQRFIVNGNYTSGNVSVLKIDSEGKLNLHSQLIQFSEGSINKSRQDKSHIHACVFSPDYKYVFFPDLGADKIRVFEFDSSKAEPLVEKKDLTVNTVAGSGPRHFTFHPGGKFAYCTEELSGCVSAYNYRDGELDSIQRIFSYSKKQESYGSSDIHISPDGLFLYASNRWEDENTISIFSINQTTGKLKLIKHQSTFGDHPRMFAIDPSGNFLLVANLVTGNVVVFKRNIKTGLLTKTKHEIKINQPSCPQFRRYKA